MKGPVAALASLIAAMLLAPVASAKTPADAEIEQVQALLGFTPATTRRVIQASFEQQPEFSRYDAARRSCFLDALQPDVEGELRESFRTLFVDSETIAAWLHFGQTAGGDRLTGLMRSTIDAKLEGKAVPDALAAVAEMSDAEQADVSAFMESPAAVVLQKGFPNMTIPVASGKRAAQRCGIEWPEK